MYDFKKARDLLHRFKGNNYLFGNGVLNKVGQIAAKVGKKAALVRDTFENSDNFVTIISESLQTAGVQLAATVKGPEPNCPREDLLRITDELKQAYYLVHFEHENTIY